MESVKKTSRRQYLPLLATTAGAVGGTGWLFRDKITDQLKSSTFKIQSHSIGGSMLVPGDSLYVFAKIKNVSDQQASAVTTLAIGSENHKEVVDNTTTKDVPAGETSIAQFEWEIPEDYPNGSYEFELQIRPESDPEIDDTADGVNRIIIHRRHKPARTWGSRAKWTFLNGAIYGEWGQKFRVRDAGSEAYLLGWLVGSAVPVADVFADIRDCRVKTNNDVWDQLDCGGMVISVVGSIGTITGYLATIPTGGAGIAISLKSFQIDLLEDIQDVVRVIDRYLHYHPELIDTVVRVIGKTTIARQLQPILKRLPTKWSRRISSRLEIIRVYSVEWTDHPVLLRTEEYYEKEGTHIALTPEEIDWVMDDYTIEAMSNPPGSNVITTFLYRKVPGKDEYHYIQVVDRTRDPEAEAVNQVVLIDDAGKGTWETFQDWVPSPPTNSE